MRTNIAPSDQEIDKFTSPLLSCLRKHYLDEEVAIRDKASPPGIGFEDLQSSLPEEIGGGFVAAVSLHDTNTLFVSSGITRTLGYQQDMLIGQSLLGYLYPRDRLTFVSFLSQGLQARFSTTDTTDKFVFYVRIREYRGLKGGFEVAGAKSSCKPFQFKCSLKDITLDPKQAGSRGDGLETTLVQTICFIIVAIPLISAHKLSEERNPAMVPFTTRHTPSCHFSHLDAAGLPFLGYFPQDIIGHPIFDFYHQDDLPLIREVYDTITMQEGSFFSKPYRFKVFNGDYIILETEWSCFINPWSKKFEFIVGQHRILQGPVCIDVFCETSRTNQRTNDQRVMKKAEEEICALLAQPVKRATVTQHKNQRILRDKSYKRKRTLAARVTELIQGVGTDGGAAGQAGDEDADQEVSKTMRSDVLSLEDEGSWSDKESVLMGVISPHRENSEDLQDQRLQDNIERFFASQPKTICPSSSTGSSSQNQSPDGSGSNDGSGTTSSSCNQKQSSNDSAFQSGSCGDGGVTDAKMPTDESSRTGAHSQLQSADHHHGSHGNRVFLETLTEEMLAQHDRACQRQMRKQAQVLQPSNLLLKHHSIKPHAMGQDHHHESLVNKKALKEKPKIKKHSDGGNKKTGVGISTLDEMFRNSSFAIQPPFALGFSPFLLSSSTACQSCAPEGKQTQPQQHIFLPIMCSVQFPVCSAKMEDATASPAAAKGASCKSVRIQTEPTSPIRHMSPFEEEDVDMQAEADTRGRMEGNRGSKSKEPSLTEGSFESTLFTSSSDESCGRAAAAAGGEVASSNDQSLDQMLMETPVKSEVAAPWITATGASAPDYVDEEAIYRYQRHESGCSDTPREQPDLVKRQFSLLRKEKTSSTPAPCGEASDNDFKVRTQPERSPPATTAHLVPGSRAARLGRHHGRGSVSSSKSRPA